MMLESVKKTLYTVSCTSSAVILSVAAQGGSSEVKIAALFWAYQCLSCACHEPSHSALFCEAGFVSPVAGVWNLCGNRLPLGFALRWVPLFGCEVCEACAFTGIHALATDPFPCPPSGVHPGWGFPTWTMPGTSATILSSSLDRLRSLAGSVH